MSFKIQEVKYQDYYCFLFSNGIIDLYIAKDFGPRILSAGFHNELNLFALADGRFKTKLGTWMLYGGHRFWLAPEVTPNTYSPDNDPIEVIPENSRLLIVQNDRRLKLQKKIELSFPGKNKVKVVHQVINNGAKEKQWSIWPVTIMRPNGFAVIPQNQKKTDVSGYLPNRNLVLWTYSKYPNKRIRITDKHIFIKQAGKDTFKIGQQVPLNWCAYYYQGYVFKKHFQFDNNRTYLDLFSNVEVYTCPSFLELETLSPLTVIQPGGFFSYTETWEFIKNKKIKFGDPFLSL